MKTPTAPVTTFDARMYQAALAYYGLPPNYNRVFKSVPATDRETNKPLFKADGTPKTWLRSCNAAPESKSGNGVWVQVNQPRKEAARTESRYPKKATNKDIALLANVTLDFEYPAEPEKALRVGVALAAYLMEQGLAEPGLPVENSGAGSHIVLPLPFIDLIEDTAERWNEAVRAVVKKHIEPEFAQLIAREQIDMDLGGFDISRILSVPGTWRPSNPGKADCEALKQGHLRCWLPPYTNGVYPTRKECSRLAELIREEYDRLSEEASPEALTKPSYRQGDISNFGDIYDAPQWLTVYATQHPNDDRSALFQSLVNATYRQYGEHTVWQLKEEINRLSGEKFNGRLDTEIKRSLKKIDEIGVVLQHLEQGEYGDALLFAHFYRGKAIYDHSSKEWYLYRGPEWKRDNTGRVRHYVSGELASFYISTAAKINLILSEIQRQLESQPKNEVLQQQLGELKTHIDALYDRAGKLRFLKRCSHVLDYASSLPGMGITAEMWDKSTWILPVTNGVIDLRTGKLRSGKPEDYIRTVAPSEWQGIDAPADRFDRFWQQVFADYPEDIRRLLIEYLQRLLGYAITGANIEHIFAVFYGPEGRNGKDTLQHALTYTLGALSGAISNDVFLDTNRQRTAGGATPHLSDLQGKRLAWASEPEKGARFNVGQVKHLSGGGDIPTRGLYEKHPYNFKPTHLLILLTNHKPHADANDAAFWDRLRLVTFNMRFVDEPQGENERKKEGTLWKALEDEASGVLAWLVRGCLAWQRNGLQTPACVLEAGKDYRKEEDTIGLFINERCDDSDPSARTLASRLYAAYSDWAGRQAMNNTNFGRLLGKRFIKDKKPTRHEGKLGIHYHGIKLLPPPDEEDVKGFWLSQKTITSALQEPSGGENTQDCKECKEFSQEIPTNTIISPLQEGVYKKTINTINISQEKEAMNPLVEWQEDSVNSFEDSLHLDDDEEVIL